MKWLRSVMGVLFFYLFTFLPLSGQSRDQQVRAHIDSALTARYYRIPYDTNYVVRPEGKLTLKVRLNQTGNDFHVKGTVNGIYSKADLKTSHKTTMSIGASYRGISASLSINPAKMSGAYKDYEFNLNYYSSRISLDFSYQRSESLAGDIIRILNALLKPTEVNVICILYGIGTPAKPRWELAEDMGKTEERIRQIEQHVLYKIRNNQQAITLLTKYRA
jgi:hypothetical protein